MCRDTRSLEDLIQELKLLEICMNADNNQYCSISDFANPESINWLEKEEILSLKLKVGKEIRLKLGESHAQDHIKVSKDFKRYLDSKLSKEIKKIFFMITIGWVTFKDQNKSKALELAIANFK